MSNNHELDEATEHTMSQLRTHLDSEPSHELKKRLQDSRMAALDSLDKKPLFSVPSLMPALGVTAALALGVGIAWNALQESPNLQNYSVSTDELEIEEVLFLAESEFTQEDFQILLADDENPDLDFFSWASAQPEFME